MPEIIQQNKYINIYLLGESDNALPHIQRIRDDLLDLVSKSIKDADCDAAYYPVFFHVTSFNLGWYTNHIIMLRPESKTGVPITPDHFREQFRRIRHFIRNQDYKNPVVVNVYADTLPIGVEEVEVITKDVLANVDNIHVEIIKADLQ